MNLDALLVLQRSDLRHLERVAGAYDGLPILFADPGLMDEAIQLGLGRLKLEYRSVDVGAHLQGRVTSEALVRALALDQRLSAERERLLGGDAHPGWDHSMMRLFFIRALIARHLGAVCAASWNEPVIGLFRPRRPQQFYFDSFVTTDVFAAGASRWRVVDEYDEVMHWVADASARCFDFPEIERRAHLAPQTAVTHVPTCFAFGKRYVEEVARAFPQNIDLPSAFWDLPVRRDQDLRTPIAGLAPEWRSEASVVYRERARAVFTEQLGDLLPHRAALSAQAECFAEHAFLQALDYQGLRRALQGTRPQFVVTDHDTGHNGPLFSVAAELAAPITVVPHSSYCTALPPHATGVTVVDRAGFRTPVRSVWGEQVSTRPVRLGKPPAEADRSVARTACLLLNTLSSQGLSYIDLRGLAEFHAAFRQLCAEHRVSLLVRLKPNGPASAIATRVLGVSQEELATILRASIEEVATASDLCVTYGEPTSAGIEFLDRGSYLLHVSDQNWPSDYPFSPAYIADRIVPSHTCAAGLVELRRLLDDVEHFRRLQRQQADAHRARSAPCSEHIFDAAPPALSLQTTRA